MKKSKQKWAFTLIELLATILILGIIVTIAVPTILKIMDNAKEGAFKVSVFSLYDAYRYKEISNQSTDIGEVDISQLSLNNEQLSIGKLKKNSNKIIEVINVSDGSYCANGTTENLSIVKGDCSSLDQTAPIINNIAIEKTTSSMTIIVSFSEPDSVIKTHQYRLLDNSGNVIIDWVKGNSLRGSGLNRISTKTFNGLTQNETYKVEVRIINNSGNEDDTVVDSRTVKLNSFNRPTISYNTENYSLEKIVTMTYDSTMTNKYKIIDNDLNTIIDWTILEGSSTDITISNYNYTVIASSSDGTTTLSNSVLIGYIDYTKPEITVNNINTVWDIKDDINLILTDNLSGVENYCITNTNDSNTCEWINIENSEIITEDYVINSNGIYYAFAKDNVGNISNGYEFEITKVDTKTPEKPIINANDHVANASWHSTDFRLEFSGATSSSGIVYKYWSSVDSVITEDSKVEITDETENTIYYVKSCTNAGICSETSSYIVKLDKKVPEKPTITSSDAILSNNWHTNNFNLVSSGSTSISGITYYYGIDSNNMTDTGNIIINTDTTSTTYYIKACNTAGTCSANATYVVKLDTIAPSTPVITGGSNDYATNRTISMSTIATDTTSGIAKYEYYLTSVATPPTTETVGIDNGKNTSKSFNTDYDGYYIYFRAIDNVGNIGEWSSSQRLYIDIKAPTITLKEAGSATITEGDSNNILDTYFNYSSNGSAGYSLSCIDTSNGNVSITNTSTLGVGTKVVKCTITKDNGLSANISKTIVVNAKYTGVERKTYTIGSTVTYGGVEFLVAKDNGDSITLITKSNVTTSAFGSNNTWSNSTIKNYLNTTWLNSKPTILTDVEKTGIVYDSEAGAYVRLIRVDELNSSLANTSNTNFWTMTTSGSNVYYALANGSTTYTKYTASANTNGTCYSGSSTDLSSITSTHTKNTLTSTNASTIASPTATTGVISTSYTTSASGSCKANYTTDSESYNYDCNCSNYACGCSNYTCYPYNYYYITNTYSLCLASGCVQWHYSTGYTCGGYNNPGIISNCGGSGCTTSGCKGSGCTTSGCTKSTVSSACARYSSIATSSCYSTGYSRYCGSSACARYSVSSACARSTNGGCMSWISVPGACASYSCDVYYTTPLSTCSRYNVQGPCTSWSSGLNCAGYGCIESGCTTSGCLGSGCTSWNYSTPSATCTRWDPVSQADYCERGTCTLYTSWSDSTYTSSTYASTCTTCSSTCTSCETCTGSRSVYTASGSTVDWSRYVVSEQTATMGVRAVITVKKK